MFCSILYLLLHYSQVFWLKINLTYHEIWRYLVLSNKFRLQKGLTGHRLTKHLMKLKHHISHDVTKKRPLKSTICQQVLKKQCRSLLLSRVVVYRNKTNPRLLTFQNLTVQDGKSAVIQDLGTQFFLREEDLGKNRSVPTLITTGTNTLLFIDSLFLIVIWW